MATNIQTGPVHHLRLTVNDVDCSRQFYMSVLGMKVALELPPGVVLTNGSVLVGLGPSWDMALKPKNDRFSENRVGLDHLCFSVKSRDELEDAVKMLDERGILHGEIEDLGPAFGIYCLVFRDPDNIQLELSAPYN
jgi:glyoxylase I family protein